MLQSLRNQLLSTPPRQLTHTALSERNWSVFVVFCSVSISMSVAARCSLVMITYHALSSNLVQLLYLPSTDGTELYSGPVVVPSTELYLGLVVQCNRLYPAFYVN